MGEEVKAQGGVHGTNALEALVAFVASFIQMVQNAMADGKIDITDVGQLMLLVPTLPAAFESIQDVQKQLADLDDEDRKHMIQVIDEKFGDGAYEKIGERLLSAAAELAGAYDAYKQWQASKA